MPCCGTQADGLHGSSCTNTGSSESSCVLIIPCVPKAEVHLYRQCPLSGSGPSRQETLFFARQTYGLIPYGIFCIRMEGCALRITSRTAIFFIVCMTWHPWHEYTRKGDWAFSSLRLFLQLTSIRWQFMSKYSLFCKATMYVMYFCRAHGEQSETHGGIKKGWEQERVFWGYEDEGKAGQQRSRLWIWCSTLGSAAFGPHMLGRAKSKAKSSVSVVGGWGQMTESCTQRLDWPLSAYLCCCLHFTYKYI